MYLIKRCHKWQILISQTFTQEKLSRTYPKMKKLGTVIPYLKENQKKIKNKSRDLKEIQEICKSRDTPLEFGIFFIGN